MARHFRGTRPHRALHRVHGRRRDQRLAHGRRGPRRARSCAASTREFPLEPADANYTRRGRGALALPRRLGRDRRHLLGHAGVLPRLHARAPVDRRQALHVPLRERRATTCATLLRAGASDAASSQRDRRDLARRADRYSEIRTAADRARDEGRDVVHRRLSRASTSATARDLTRRRLTSCTVECAINERGAVLPTPIAGEHPLTLYVDKREIVTLMTLGAGARGARDRLPAQPAAGRLDRRDRSRCRSTGKSNAVAVTTRNGARRPRREDGEAHDDHRLRPGHGVRRPDGRDRHHPPARRRAR